MDVRTAENYRESWFIKNISTNKITIGDLLLLPSMQPNETLDALQYYTKEKVSTGQIPGCGGKESHP